ncbi:hypothetical protein V5O48_010301 [Marasmius crinis-equi]|uniref:Carboxylic ester hydrolase n=1 Tax=Marasmius crinis-equi TaxID=585013 RepID=A0ABR3F8R0_9AGAR
MILSLLCGIMLVFSSEVSSEATLDIRLTTGIYRGLATSNGTEQWLGIPYAVPPTGSKRFKAPTPFEKLSSGTDQPVNDASRYGNACPQPPSAALGAPVGEDCLYLNVWRPQNTSETAKLPVLVYFHGGAYTNGAGSAPATNPTQLLLRSVAINRPMICVSINYRLNTFGFLASSIIPKSDLNAGLLDQIEALRFLQLNLAAFGGDPEKVTIWGQSAGAGSVESLILYPPPGQKLFRAGMADTSTGPFKSSPPPEAYDKPGSPFMRLLSATGCSASSDAGNCLRDVPFEKLLNISNDMIANTLNRQLWQPTISPGTLWSTQASAKKKSGDFLSVPYLAGTNVNEGATYATDLRSRNLTGAAQEAAFDNYINRLHIIDNSSITQATLQEIHRLWAENDTTLGAPFNQGDSLYDRAAAWYRDEMYLAPRRLFFDYAAPKQDIYAYYFKEFLPGGDPTLGAEWPRYNLETRPVLQLLRGNITIIPDNWDIEKTDFLNTDEVLKGFQK